MDAQATIWGPAITDTLRDRKASARKAAERDSKPWTPHADRQTKNILGDKEQRKISQATAAKYRHEYDRLRAEGLTALDRARTRQHYDLLRTASHYCMETDVRAFRRSAERARRAGDIDQAQKLTLEAWRLATEMDVQFRQPDRLAVFGVRPAELKRGIEISVATDPKTGDPFLVAKVEGVKVNAERGQAWRTLVVPVENAAASGLAAAVRERGGSKVVSMTDTEHRSPNRARKPSGLSCYSFRHAVASQLKREALRKPETTATGQPRRRGSWGTPARKV